jgi:hypothetical protein
MATRSSISIRNPDGSYTGVYCHWDGYLSHNGRILEENYTTEEKIRELMALGSISSLREEIGEQHPFDSPIMMDDAAYLADVLYGRMTTAYGRDRGETDVAAITRPTLHLLMEHIGQEYNYVWEDGSWKVRCYHTDDEFVTLAEARRLEAQTDNG